MEVIETCPEIRIAPTEIERIILTELERYHQIYSPLFARKEQREHSHCYLKGLLAKEGKKSSEAIMLRQAGDDVNAVRSLQQFVGQGKWSDEAILDEHRCQVNLTLGEEDGVLILDGSGFPKQGEHSVGVKRQWCGQVGKVANCQMGVFLSYASRKGYSLLDRRLYLPVEWVKDDEFKERREKCGVPDKIVFKTQPELGAEMIKAVKEAGTLQYRWLTCDEAFGRDTHFLDTIAPWVSYFAEVPLDTCVWLERPQTAVPNYCGRGRKPTLEKLLSGEPKSQTVQTIAQTLPPQTWSRQFIKEGSKGTMVADFAAVRVVATRNSLPGPDLWLVFRRELGHSEVKAFLSNAPIDTKLETFAWLSGMRWPTETIFQIDKQLIGLGDYQLRSWIGWHHHMTLCILAHHFLVQVNQILLPHSPALTLPQTILLLKAVLPLPVLDLHLALDIIRYRQRNNFKAKLSHHRSRLRRLNLLE